MIGPILIAIVLLVVLPVSFFMVGGIVASALGFFLRKDIEAEYEGSEYVALS